MAAIKAHFDGRVFVPDEPVLLQSGEQVVVQPAAPQAARVRKADASFLRKLNIDLDARAVREIIDNPELRIENL
jgi:hypothetical protein